MYTTPRAADRPAARSGRQSPGQRGQPTARCDPLPQGEVFLIEEHTAAYDDGLMQSTTDLVGLASGGLGEAQSGLGEAAVDDFGMPLE